MEGKPISSLSHASVVFFSLLLPQLMRFLPDKSSMISCGWKASSGFIRVKEEESRRARRRGKIRWAKGTPTSFSFFFLFLSCLSSRLSIPWTAIFFHNVINCPGKERERKRGNWLPFHILLEAIS